MPSSHANRVQMTVSGTPGTGTITLNAASSGHQTFGSAHGANATVDCLFTDGTAWEVARDCTYTHSGTTLSRGTLEASSTGSAITLTSAAVVSQILTAGRGNVYHAASRGHIAGGVIAYSSTTVITVSACQIVVNGKLLETTSTTTLTSASTMKDLNNATVTLGASKSYYVYAFDNAGTLEFRVQDYAAATYGGAPTFDVDHDYWIGPSVGAQARRIGKFFTNGSSQVIQFSYIGRGRYRAYNSPSAVTLLSGGTGGGSGALASITITPYIGADDSEYVIALGMLLSSGTAVSCQAVASAYGSASAIYHANRKVIWSTGLGTNLLGGDCLPNTGTLHYWSVTANTSTTVQLYEVRHFV